MSYKFGKSSSVVDGDSTHQRLRTALKTDKPSFRAHPMFPVLWFWAGPLQTSVCKIKAVKPTAYTSMWCDVWRHSALWHMKDSKFYKLLVMVDKEQKNAKSNVCKIIQFHHRDKFYRPYRSGSKHGTRLLTTEWASLIHAPSFVPIRAALDWGYGAFIFLSPLTMLRDVVGHVRGSTLIGFHVHRDSSRLACKSHLLPSEMSPTFPELGTARINVIRLAAPVSSPRLTFWLGEFQTGFLISSGSLWLHVKPEAETLYFFLP